MKTGSLTSRISALALLAVVVSLAYIGVAAPLLDAKSQVATELAQHQKTVTSLHTRISDLRNELARPLPADRRSVWNGQQVGAISAKLQVGISGIAAQNGLSLRSLRTDEGEPIAGLDTLVLEVEFETPLDKALTFFEFVERHEPAFLLENLSLRRVATSAPEADQPSVYAIARFIAPIVVEAPL